MKTLKRIRCAWGWWHIGVSARKAWQLAGHNVRKATYAKEIALFCVLCAAYAFTAWNDSEASRMAERSADARADVAERNLAHCFNGGWFNANGELIGCDKVYSTRM